MEPLSSQYQHDPLCIELLVLKRIVQVEFSSIADPSFAAVNQSSKGRKSLISWSLQRTGSMRFRTNAISAQVEEVRRFLRGLQADFHLRHFFRPLYQKLQLLATCIFLDAPEGRFDAVPGQQHRDHHQPRSLSLLCSLKLILSCQARRLGSTRISRSSLS
jgi:hypothetical protein